MAMAVCSSISKSFFWYDDSSSAFRYYATRDPGQPWGELSNVVLRGRMETCLDGEQADVCFAGNSDDH